MASSLEWHEKSHKARYGERRDRFSSLSDEVLVLILSFLPTKHAVGTCILSRRWQCLFIQVTNLDFDESLVFHPKNSLENNVSARMSFFRFKRRNPCPRYPHLKLKSSFKDFVDRVMMLHQLPSISKFHLKCGLAFDCSNVNTWIQIALLRGVVDLDISAFDYE